jgi:DNA-binding response OmpR family regulator
MSATKQRRADEGASLNNAAKPQGENKMNAPTEISIQPAGFEMVYEGKTARLTPTEHLLIQRFVNSAGGTIPIKELEALFRKAGRSATSNNVRHAIFALRMKMEQVSRRRVSIRAVYGQGYRLFRKSEVVQVDLGYHRAGMQVPA